MITIKRGDTFAFYANITDEEGSPLLIDAVNLKSEVRDTDYALIDTLVNVVIEKLTQEISQHILQKTIMAIQLEELQKENEELKEKIN